MQPKYRQSGVDVKELLDTITALSHTFGSPTYVLGGGGNTSVKNEEMLWVKPSGTTLADITPDGFLPLVRARIEPLYTQAPPDEVNAREAFVKDMMQAAVAEGATGRPSVEAPLHNVFNARYIVHTHPTLVSGLVCGREGEAACARLFPDALWMPYVDPGYTLCMEVRMAIMAYEKTHGKQPSILMLENHGVFVAGDDEASIAATYDRLISALQTSYELAGVSSTPITHAAGIVDDADRSLLEEVLGADARFIVACAPFEAACGPLTPDHIVYAKSYPYTGDLTREGLLSFVRKHGYAPRVVVRPDAVYGLGGSAKAAALALTFAQDAARVVSLSDAFGGVQWMSDAARSFIENWEVESYRSKVSTS
jgi:rhamnose utilization protein RhaD (predicted bifunctional aldolase and dehydrogenase)